MDPQISLIQIKEKKMKMKKKGNLQKKGNLYNRLEFV